jgi:hypothetical protein
MLKRRSQDVMVVDKHAPSCLLEHQGGGGHEGVKKGQGLTASARLRDLLGLRPRVH